MENFPTSVIELIGNTPMIYLEKYCKEKHLKARIFAKVEYFNPGGSIKDRIALNMILKAEEERKLKPGGIIVEPTSGNTGIGLAMVAASRGYRLVLTMPDTMSQERRSLLAAYGAKIVLTPGNKGMAGAIAEAEKLVAELPDAIMLQQFSNPANPNAHYHTTGPEIWEQTDGTVDILVAGVGTGGTISGCGRYLKEQNKHIRVIAIEPQESAVLSGNSAGAHKIQGIGAGFVPENFDEKVVDAILPVPSDEALDYARQLATTEGLLVGISSGAALAAATSLAKQESNKGKNIVVILPDTGERYLSTELFKK